RGTIPFLLADIGEGITECEVIQWFVKPGDRIEQFTRICEVQSDKAAVEITSRYDGVVKVLHYKEGDMAKVGRPLVDIETDGDAEVQAAAGNGAVKGETQKAAAAAEVASVVGDVTEVGDSITTFATPAVRRIAKEKKVDLSKVVGTGKGGRILKEDVISYCEGAIKPVKASEVASTIHLQHPFQPASVHPHAGETKLVPLSAIQKAMFRQMTKSLTIPHFGYSDEIVLNPLAAFRDALNAHLAMPTMQGRYPFKKITYMPIFLKAMSLALREYPILNACLVEDTDGKVALQYRENHNIGVAMDTPNGLIVPNVKNVQQRSIFEIAAELARLKELGARNAIASADLGGGTITLSNIGSIGGTYLHPVLVSSEVCIGAVGKSMRVPRFETVVDRATGEKTEVVVAKEVLAVSWNADHRVIDGATMARFVAAWKRYLETPALLGADTR
ncbi:hypothetical protein HK101_006624, partial [Irineochytrium annulatum]